MSMAKNRKKTAFRGLATHPNFRSLTIGASLIFFWRGAWGLMDMYLFPNQPSISYILSVVLGILIVFLIDHRLDDLE